MNKRQYKKRSTQEGIYDGSYAHGKYARMRCFYRRYLTSIPDPRWRTKLKLEGKSVRQFRNNLRRWQYKREGC